MPSTNDTLAPFGEGTGTISSSASSVNNQTAELVFLCQGCFTADAGKTTLTIFLSEVEPEYTDWPLAMLPMDGAMQKQFAIDTASAQFHNFATMLRIAGVST